jgi:hypothetical protein
MTLTVTLSQTTPSRPGKQSRPVWVVDGPDLAAYADALYALGGKKYHGTFSFWSDPSEDVARLGDQDRQSFAERQESMRERAADRAERLSERSGKHARAADVAAAEAHRIMDGIPLGQPILVGHHSERRARRDQERIHSKTRQSIDEASYSAHLASRAAFNERKAEGVHTAGFCQRRIKEATADLHKVERYLERPDREPVNDDDKWNVCTGEWRADLVARKAEYEERIAYWQAEIEQLGGVQFSKATIVKGDAVKIRGRWRRVVRANAKTVSVETGYSWTDTCPYAEIQDRRPGAVEPATPAPVPAPAPVATAAQQGLW